MQPIAMITRSVWDAFSESERGDISRLYEARIVEPTQYGVIMDVQGADQSTPGTNTGAALGGSVASAAYIDRSLGGGNYSAKNHLAIGILGAALGSNLDRTPTSQFQFRYTIKTGDGEIGYFDEVKSTQFRHSVGVCVTVPDLSMISQQVCNQTPDMARQRFLSAKKP
jgi:outer membrane lipoprotein SlyB